MLAIFKDIESLWFWFAVKQEVDTKNNNIFFLTGEIYSWPGSKHENLKMGFNVDHDKWLHPFNSKNINFMSINYKNFSLVVLNVERTEPKTLSSRETSWWTKISISHKINDSSQIFISLSSMVIILNNYKHLIYILNTSPLISTKFIISFSFM